MGKRINHLRLLHVILLILQANSISLVADRRGIPFRYMTDKYEWMYLKLILLL